MQGRSWMAALTLAVAGTSLVTGLSVPSSARAEGPATTANSTATTTTSARKVRLDLAIDGLSPGGCDLEIKPGHAGCQFKPRKDHIADRDAGKKLIEFDDVRSTGVDRDCVFAITIREPGQVPKTVHRGLRLAAESPGRPTPAQTLACYLRSPSKMASKESEMRARR